MTDTAATQRPNKVSIVDAGPARKKIQFQIPAETVNEKLQESMDSFLGEAQLPGFRKGRAPKSLVEKRFGSTMRDEAKKQLVASAYQDAIKDTQLKIVGEPFSDTLDKAELKSGQPFEFEVEVEVQPEFTLPSIEGIPVLRPLIEVGETLVQEEFARLRINEGRLESRDAAEPGDYLTGRGKMVGRDGHEFYDINGAVVQRPAADKGGKGMILGVVVDDFEAQFGSPKPGETATVKVKGPEQHEIEGIRNNDLTITFTVERIDRIVPAETEMVLKQFGMESEEQLLGAIRSRMGQRVQIEQQTAMRQQIALYLLKNTQIALPERLTAQQAMRNLERQRLELMYRGVEASQIEQQMAELRASTGQNTLRELKMFFILSRIGDEQNIQVLESEINGRISQLAGERGVRPEALRQELVQRNQIYGIYQQVREHKVFDMMLSKASISDMSVEDYRKHIDALNLAT